MFNQTQIEELSKPLLRSAVKSRSQSGRNLSYIEGWHAIAEANRIFGYDAWTRETVDIRLVSERARKIGPADKPERQRDGWGVSYIAKVRVVVVGGIVREGIGSGHGIDVDLGLAHESAIKEAETDGMKRALMTFGNPFGLALYDKEQSNVADEPTASEVYVSVALQLIRDCQNAEDLRAWWAAESETRKRILDAEQKKTLNEKCVERARALTPAKEAA